MIKPLLIGLALLSLVAYFRVVRSVMLDRLIALFIFLSLSLLVIFPDTTTWVANRLGVVRGTDLVLYLFMLGATFLFIMIYARNAGVDARITKLVRELALYQATAPDDKLVNHTTSPSVSPTASTE